MVLSLGGVNGSRSQSVPTVSFADGTIYPDASALDWIPTSALLTFTSAHPAAVATDADGGVVLLGNYWQPVEVVATSATEFALQLESNPLAEFVELPEQYSRLAYSNLLCGVLRGALEMVQMRVECTLTKDALWGDEVTEMRVVLKEMMEEEYIDDE